MRNSLTEMRFYETYYYTHIVNNVIEDPWPYIRKLNELWEDCEAEFLTLSFPKWSRLHSFIYHIVDSVVDEEISDVTIDLVAKDSEYKVWVNQALKHHNIEAIGFRNWLAKREIALKALSVDDLVDYYAELYDSEVYPNLITHISSEVFYILFSNRALLANFNHFLATVLQDYFSSHTPEELSDYFDRPGKLKRTHIPEWAKRAIFYRDRGMCASCNRDLSGLVSSQPDKHVDHIVPLAQGGLNDVTNLQLLCGQCNLSKSGRFKQVSNTYESWY